jgi:hypothetical protein
MILLAVIRPAHVWLLFALLIPIAGPLFIWKTDPGAFEDARAWLKGARGEEQVGKTLEGLRSKGYKALHDIDTGRGNLDHVVIGPTGVFAIETKAIRGRMYLGSGGRLMVSGKDRDRIFAQALAEAFEVKRRLEKIGLKVWVQALVILTNSRLPKGPIRKSNVMVIEVGNLTSQILSAPGPTLTDHDIVRAAAAILRGDQTVKVSG